MDISRKGAERDRGTTSIISGLPLSGGKEFWTDNVYWDNAKKQVVICAQRVLHTDGKTHHNYTIRLSLKDVTELIGLLGHAGSARDAALFRDHLSKHVPAIVKLLACATGLFPTPISVDKK